MYVIICELSVLWKFFHLRTISLGVINYCLQVDNLNPRKIRILPNEQVKFSMPERQISILILHPCYQRYSCLDFYIPKHTQLLLLVWMRDIHVIEGRHYDLESFFKTHPGKDVDENGGCV